MMTYISSTDPGVTRGPHEHVDQADLFCFIGPSNFKLRMWDNRQDSETYNHVMTLVVGEDNPKAVLVPKGVVHAYQNVGCVPGIVINCPNRLYMGMVNKKKSTRSGTRTIRRRFIGCRTEMKLEIGISDFGFHAAPTERDFVSLAENSNFQTATV